MTQLIKEITFSVTDWRHRNRNFRHLDTEPLDTMDFVILYSKQSWLRIMRYSVECVTLKSTDV